MKLKTQPGKDLLHKEPKEAIMTMNGIIANPMSKSELLSDVYEIRNAMLDSGLAVIDNSRHGLNKVPFIVLAEKEIKKETISSINFDEPIKKNLLCDSFDSWVAMKYMQTKIRSHNKGLEFNLTIRDLSVILRKKRCYYSGIVFDEQKNSITLDRIDNKKGYVKGNVVACSRLVNNLKNHILESNNMTSKEAKKMFKSFTGLMEK